jgi:VanZ family protein
MKKWAVLLSVLVVSVIVLVDLQKLGPLRVVYSVPHGDKVAHFALFGLLSMSLNLAAFETWPRVRRLALAWRVSGVLAVLMAMEELSQTLLPARTASVWDVAAGYLGVALFTWMALRVADRLPAGPHTK